MDIISLESSTLSIIPKVEFLNVQDQYSYDADLICEYTLVAHVPQEHDRIAIYKIGFAYVKDYVLFEWAPVSAEGNPQRVTFNRPSLPRNPAEMYHFCYISAENKVLGASTPFQFCAEAPKSMKLSLLSTSCNGSLSSMQTADLNRALGERDREIARLQDENALLRETLRMIVQSKRVGGVEKDVEELKSTVDWLKKALCLQENEVNGLKKKLAERDNLMKERNVSVQSAEKLKSINNILDMGELETLPPFPQFIHK